MDVLLDAAVFEIPLTGVGKAALLTYTYALKQRPEFKIVALHRKRLQCTLPLSIKSRQCCRIFPSKWWRQYVLPRVVRREQPTAVHFPWNGSIPQLPQHVKVITTLHDVLPMTIPGYFKQTTDETAYRHRLQRDLDRTDLLLTDSEFSRQEIIKYFQPKHDPVVLYLSATLESSQHKSNLTRPNRSKENPFFLYVGGYDPRKGLDALLRVHTELFRSGRLKVRLVLTGSKNYYSPEFKALLDAAVACGAAEERGYVSDAELSELLCDALALVYPSRYEGFGLPPLEAMAQGCPVVTTRETSLPEICGEAVLYVHPTSDEDFKSALTRLAESPELQNFLRVAGLEQAKKFSWSKTAEQFLSAYDTLIAR